MFKYAYRVHLFKELKEIISKMLKNKILHTHPPFNSSILPVTAPLTSLAIKNENSLECPTVA